jgi:hypothetical protein
VLSPSLTSCVIIPAAIKSPNFVLVWKPTPTQFYPGLGGSETSLHLQAAKVG